MGEVIDIIRKVLPPKLKWQAVFLVVLMGISALLEVFSIGLIMPLVSAVSEPELLKNNKILSWFYNWVSPSSAGSFIIICASLLAVFFILKNIYNYVLICRNSTYAKKVKMSFINRIFLNYLKAPYSFYSNVNSFELINHIQQISENCHLVVQALQLVLSELIVVVAVSLTLCIVMPLVAAVIGGLAIIAFGGFYYPMIRHFSKFGAIRLKASENMLRILSHAFASFKEVKLNAQEQRFTENMSISLDKQCDAAKRVNDLSQIPRLTLETVTVIIAAGVITVLVVRQTSSKEMVVMAAILIAAMFRLIPCISRIQYHLGTLRSGKAFLEQVYIDLKQIPIENGSSQYELGTFERLDLKNVSFEYEPMKGNVFEHLDLSLHRNDCLAIVGPTGCGKTTLIDVIMGFLPPTAGTVICNGLNIFSSLASWRRKIGYVSQNFYLYDDSIAANVAFCQEEDTYDYERINESLRLAQLNEFVQSLPEKEKTQIGENGARLSGGQRQRLAIARALYSRPEILILDEATSALDNETEKAFIDALQVLKGKVTIIMIAHRLSSLCNCTSTLDLSLFHNQKLTSH